MSEPRRWTIYKSTAAWNEEIWVEGQPLREEENGVAVVESKVYDELKLELIERSTIGLRYNVLYKEQQTKLIAYKAQCEKLSEVLIHAIDCGHFSPDGSTQGWAKQVLAEYETWKK